MTNSARYMNWRWLLGYAICGILIVGATIAIDHTVSSLRSTIRSVSKGYVGQQNTLRSANLPTGPPVQAVAGKAGATGVNGVTIVGPPGPSGPPPPCFFSARQCEGPPGAQGRPSVVAGPKGDPGQNPPCLLTVLACMGLPGQTVVGAKGAPGQSIAGPSGPAGAASNVPGPPGAPGPSPYPFIFHPTLANGTTETCTITGPTGNPPCTIDTPPPPPTTTTTTPGILGG